MNTMSVDFAVAPELTMNPAEQKIALANALIGMLISQIIWLAHVGQLVISGKRVKQLQARHCPPEL